MDERMFMAFYPCSHGHRAHVAAAWPEASSLQCPWALLTPAAGHAPCRCCSHHCRRQTSHQLCQLQNRRGAPWAAARMPWNQPGACPSCQTALLAQGLLRLQSLVVVECVKDRLLVQCAASSEGQLCWTPCKSNVVTLMVVLACQACTANTPLVM